MATWSGVGDYSITEIGPVCVASTLSSSIPTRTAARQAISRTWKWRWECNSAFVYLISSNAIYFSDQVKRMVMHIVMFPGLSFTRERESYCSTLPVYFGALNINVNTYGINYIASAPVLSSHARVLTKLNSCISWKLLCIQLNTLYRPAAWNFVT
jgi:hypothetical protein